MADLLGDIQTAASRHTAVSKLSAPTPVDQQKQFEDHWARAIKTWANNVHTDKPLVIAHAGLLGVEVVAEWTKTLEAKGYKVVADGGRLTISSSA